MDFAVIMAGGTGKRLWPLSRASRPKQVLRLLNDHTLLRTCYERLKGIFDFRNILVLTNAGYADLVRDALPELPYNNVIAEPAVRDTAGAIGLASAILAKVDPDASMAVVTADQIIEPAETIQRAIKDGLKFVNKNPHSLITFGIEPSYPSTQLGYIKLGEEEQLPDSENMVCKVDSFSEKPGVKDAKEYLSSGKYCWNSGMFVWKANTILNHIYTKLPEAKEHLAKIQTAWETPQQETVLEASFPKLPKISIDFAVMEKVKDVYAIRLDCRWLDMGSFAALADIIKSDENGNIVVAGHSELIDCKNNIMITEDKGHLVAAIGLENMVIAHSPDATLVCSLDNAQRLKELLKKIEEDELQQFL